MKNTIITLINDYPKHFSTKIKNNPELLNWVNTNKLVNSDIFAEEVYSAIHQTTNICKYHNIKKFDSINNGYRFCGKASKCQCTREAVSESVSKSKQNYTEDQKQKINDKRVKTTLEKYGVTNNGQTKKALEKHKEFYADKDKVAKSITKNKETKNKNHGNPNYNNPTKIKETYKQKANDGYWEKYYPKKNIAALNNKSTLEDLYVKYSPWEIADRLNVHVQTVYRYLNLHNMREPFKSAEEISVINFLKENGVTNIIENSRKILSSRKEIDIYLPDYNLAIEYNGVFWHHDKIDHITKSYHYDKFKECESQNIQLLTIFSNHWLYQRDIVKNIILTKLKKNNNSVYARNCKIVDVPYEESKEFLNKHHIQGSTRSKIRYGLEYNNKLVALMLFGDMRVAQGAKKEGNKNTAEIIRFASDGRVVGGASKLLKHFIRNNHVDMIISYSDNEWSDGNLYKQLGFILENESLSYRYIKPRDKKFTHRYSFSKHKLVQKGYPPNKTENEIIHEMGLLKIWDCGKKKWVLRINPSN